MLASASPHGCVSVNMSAFLYHRVPTCWHTRMLTRPHTRMPGCLAYLHACTCAHRERSTHLHACIGIYAGMMVSAAENLPLGVLTVRCCSVVPHYLGWFSACMARQSVGPCADRVHCAHASRRRVGIDLTGHVVVVLRDGLRKGDNLQ